MPVGEKEQELSEEEREKILEEIPTALWTKHATDIGLVKSAGLVKIQVKRGSKLPYQRPYPFRP